MTKENEVTDVDRQGFELPLMYILTAVKNDALAKRLQEQIVELARKDRAATLSRLLENEPTIADVFPIDPANNPDAYKDMLSVVKWYKTAIQSELDKCHRGGISNKTVTEDKIG